MLQCRPSYCFPENILQLLNIPEGRQRLVQAHFVDRNKEAMSLQSWGKVECVCMSVCGYMHACECVCVGTYMSYHACGDYKVPQMSLPSTLLEKVLFVVSHGILQVSCSPCLDTGSQVLVLSL